MKQGLIITLLFLLHHPLILHAQSITPEWISYLETNGEQGTRERLPFVFTDLDQNVFVCGQTYHPGPITGFTTSKYDSSGLLLWDRRYDYFSIDEIKSAATDASRNIYVVGNTINPFNSLSAFLLIKYNSDGDTLWTYWYNNNVANNTTSVRRLFVLPNQQVILVGGLSNPNSGTSGAIVLCFDPNGQVLWQKLLPNKGVFDAELVDDNIVMWGGRTLASGGITFHCWTISQTGDEISLSDPTEVYDDYFRFEYHIDKNGNLYIGDFYGEYKLTKFNTKGITAWKYNKPIAPSPIPNAVLARAQAIKTDEEGNVFFSGDFPVDSTVMWRFFTTCLDQAGNLNWEHILVLDSTFVSSLAQAGDYHNGIYSTTGTFLIDDPLKNYYTYFIAHFDKYGFKGGGVSRVLNELRLYPTYVYKEYDHVFVTGMTTDTILSNPRKQFIAKHTLSSMISGSKELHPLEIAALQVFPNPASDVLHISFTAATASRHSLLHIVNSTGQVCMTQIVPIQNGSNTIDVSSVRSLSPGIYSIVIDTGKSLMSARFVKI